MNALAFAWRSLVRQPARTLLGVLGVAAVGALLFDMLLLSHGLVVSMRQLLDATGYDIRVTATGDPPRDGPAIARATEVTRAILGLEEIRAAIAVRFVDGQFEASGGGNERTDMAARTLSAGIQGVSRGPDRPWTLVRGRDIAGALDVVVNEAVASAAGLEPGGTLVVRASCQPGAEALPPVRVTVTGVAEFPFEVPGARTIAADLDTLGPLCGHRAADEADVILVASATASAGPAGGNRAAAAQSASRAIEALGLPLRAITNDEVVARLQESSFTYFQQISSVLTAVTVSFALLLISVLLTVSVNQRLGEIAALRAIGFSAARVVGDVFAESALLVGLGGALSLPLGVVLSSWLDGILKSMPGIPSGMHFFVFERSALALHVALLMLTAVVAALYPMHLVSRLPIASTLRAEIVS